MRIPVEDLNIGAGGVRTNDPNVPRPHIPAIRCLDPATGDYVDNVVIGDTVLTTPTGIRFLIFENFVGRTKVDMAGKKEEFYVQIPENKFLKFKPRGKAYGKEIPRDVRKQLAVAPERELPADAAAREKRLNTILEMMGKRYGIFPVINSVFSDPQTLDHLDKCLIPETWATSTRTEHTTNVIRLKKFGGSSADIDADFIAVRDMKNVDEAISDVMDLRAELAMGGEEEQDPNNPRPQRQREFSKGMPRQHANAVYANGNWQAKQRVHDPEFFRKAGGKTPVYELLSKNIQEGLATVNIKSVLALTGEIEDDEYVLKAVFSSTLNARGSQGRGEEVGNLFPPITVGLRKLLPRIDDGEGNLNPVNFDKDPNFFVDEGRTTRRIPKTGFLPTLMRNLGNEIKTKIDPDEVLGTMLQLVQNAIDQVPEGAPQ
jgi:hypothetical protein